MITPISTAKLDDVSRKAAWVFTRRAGWLGAPLSRPLSRMCRLSKPTLAGHAPAANDNRTSIPDIEL